MGRCKYDAFGMKCHNLKQRTYSQSHVNIRTHTHTHAVPPSRGSSGSPWQCGSNDKSPFLLILSVLMCCAAKTGAQKSTWQTMNVKKYHLEGSGLISNLHVIRFVLWAVLRKRGEQKEMFVIREDKMSQTTLKSLWYLWWKVMTRRV